MGQFTQHQRQYIRVFGNSPDGRFDVGDSCLVRNKRNPFRKSSVLFYPDFESDYYTVLSVDKKYLPWKYKVSRQGSSSVIKQLYAFEMRKVTPSAMGPTLSSEPLTLSPNNGIVVNDIIHRDNSTLRSGRVLPNKGVVFYRIVVNGKQDIVPGDTLRVLKRSLGGASVSYGPFFSRLGNAAYII